MANARVEIFRQRQHSHARRIAAGTRESGADGLHVVGNFHRRARFRAVVEQRRGRAAQTAHALRSLVVPDLKHIFIENNRQFRLFDQPHVHNVREFGFFNFGK